MGYACLAFHRALTLQVLDSTYQLVSFCSVPDATDIKISGVQTVKVRLYEALKDFSHWASLLALLTVIAPSSLVNILV